MPLLSIMKHIFIILFFMLGACLHRDQKYLNTVTVAWIPQPNLPVIIMRRISKGFYNDAGLDIDIQYSTVSQPQR
jgi:ABC-type nitrate/sulfonate/bicarbonate transport system substrate-binding protein